MFRDSGLPWSSTSSRSAADGQLNLAQRQMVRAFMAVRFMVVCPEGPPGHFHVWFSLLAGSAFPRVSRVRDGTISNMQRGSARWLRFPRRRYVPGLSCGRACSVWGHCFHHLVGDRLSGFSMGGLCFFADSIKC